MIDQLTPADVGEEPELKPPREYAPTTLGMLTRQRDEAQASADSDRLFAEQVLARATETDERVAQLETAIAALTSQENTA